MTLEEAKRILHPDTTLEALSEIEYYGGFNGQQAKIKAVEQACVVACEALAKQIPKKPYDINTDCRTFDCPSCLSSLYAEDELENVGYCCVCGQALDWSDAT